MKITLINPPVKKVVEAWDKPKHPNLSLGYLAGYLESRNIKCNVVDAKLEGLTPGEALRRCLGQDVVGITSLTHEIVMAAKLADKIKEKSPQTKIIIGGAHATALPKETMESFNSFDFLVYGEGEETLYELVDAIKAEKGFEKITGLVFRRGNDVVVNPQRMPSQDLNSLPYPAWHLFPKTSEYFIITARGCPFSCIFCMRAHGQKVRVRSVSNVIEEFEMLANQGAKYIYVADETFTLFKKRTIEICDELIERGLNKVFRWDAETRVNCIDFETLQKMKEAGCVLVRFGIESGNPEILKATKKGITIEEVKKAIKMAKKARLKTQGLFILGHPNETKKTMKDTINLAVKLNTTMVAFGIMTPYPGTEVYELAKRGQGGYKLLSSDWRDYNKQIGNALELEKVGRKEIETLQFLGYMKFYFYNFKLGEIAKNFIENRNLAWAMLKNIFTRG